MGVFLDVVSGLITSFLIVIISFFYLYFNLKKKLKEDDKETSVREFYRKFVLEKIGSYLAETQFKIDAEDNPSRPSNEQIMAVSDKGINLNKVLKRASKNYGSDDEYSIRTWYGINYKKLISPDIEYVSFSFKGENEPPIYLKAVDIINFIKNNLSVEEQNKYKRRNSFDTYLMKTHEGKWYITRLGMHLDSAIEIKFL